MFENRKAIFIDSKKLIVCKRKCEKRAGRCREKNYIANSALATFINEKEKILKLSELSNMYADRKPMRFEYYQLIYDNVCTLFNDVRQKLGHFGTNITC